ncbi:MAG: BlaI/MecI/CopY family transcriptional regulator [Cryomorphaceae bacterium]|nr:BlaI/MecI/CopY family transcriptional regulator [Flavobacteriales bacterium]
MRELTKAEAQVMQVIWQKGKCFVKEIIEELPEPKPAYNTVSTIVRILESKDFVDHEVFGKSHRYYAVIDKDDYRKFTTNQLVSSYFSGSPSKLLSFFIEEKDIDAGSLDEMLELIKKAKKSHE